MSAIDADQYMLASPIRVKSVSTPSAAKACAKISETWLSLIVLLSFRKRPAAATKRKRATKSCRPELRGCRRYRLLAMSGRWRSPLLVAACGKRVGVRDGRPRLLGHQLRDVLGELGEDRTSEVHPTRICKGFERAGNVEIGLRLSTRSCRRHSPRQSPRRSPAKHRVRRSRALGSCSVGQNGHKRVWPRREMPPRSARISRASSLGRHRPRRIW